jgi:hypothetical protein
MAIYGKKTALDNLRPSLAKSIQEWIDANAESKAWQALDSYVGDDTAGLMSDAAIAVLGGMVNVQDYLKAEGDLK